VAMGHVLRFPGGYMGLYDAVTKELGISGKDGWPDGLASHAAGATEDGFVVVEWWESEKAWDDFFVTKLQPAFEKVGGIPEPQVTRFDVHNSYTSP
jgi:hypothetical protein